jgi:hypothetical protein
MLADAPPRIAGTVGMLRQHVFGRLAGYEDVYHADAFGSARTGFESNQWFSRRRG